LEEIGSNVVTLDKDDPESIANSMLSPRQTECLRGVLELKSAKEIGRDLGISPHAVEKHLRVCREKFGVTTSAEAARLYARTSRGSDFPHSELSDLVPTRRRVDEGPVLEQPVKPSVAVLEDTYGALSPDHPLTPRQTLLTIAAVSFVSIVGLLLLVACAEGIRRLVSN
jgi:DNA-binding CsgD family transcriptional regulator